MIHGLPRWAANDAMERGFSVEALEKARQLLVQAYYSAMFAYSVDDKENTTHHLKETFDIDGLRVKWEVHVFDTEIDGGGARLVQTQDDVTGYVLDLSHWEFRRLWEGSYH